jgi:transposase
VQVYIGIDWSENKHDIAIMNEVGAAIVQQTIAHTPDGFLELEASCLNLRLSPDDCLFGLETAHNLVIDFRTYPTPENAMALTLDDFKVFARRHGYMQPKRLPECLARLQASRPQATPETISVFRDEAVLLATHLLHTVQSKSVALRELQGLFKRHPDHYIFDSLPGAGKFLAPALLVTFGDDRQRFPAAASVQSLAGTCPVTDWSGKRRVVKFRHACDREFRDIAQKWAMASKSESLWATTYWQQVRPRCDSDSHAYRCLVNRWLAIAWKLWQTRRVYDEAYHLQQRTKHSKPRR